MSLFLVCSLNGCLMSYNVLGCSSISIQQFFNCLSFWIPSLVHPPSTNQLINKSIPPFVYHSSTHKFIQSVQTSTIHLSINQSMHQFIHQSVWISSLCINSSNQFKHPIHASIFQLSIPLTTTISHPLFLLLFLPFPLEKVRSVFS